MLSAFVNSFKIKELRERILFTLGIIFLCRLLANIPIAGVDFDLITRTLEQMAADGKGGVGFLDMFNLFSGGAVKNCAIGALGIMPYISASIIIQLMTAVVPSLQKLVREGESGRAKITQYTRYLTVILCAFQAFVLAKALMTNGLGFFDPAVVVIPGVGFLLLTSMTMVTGTLMLMWMGEQITERGIGNGISMVITINIVSSLPAAMVAMIGMFKPVDGVVRHSPFMAVTMALMIFAVIAAVVAVTQAQQKVPVQYAKRVVGRKVYGQNTYMPLRVNYAGVMPIIFAQAILMFPPMLLKYLPWNTAKEIGAALDYGTPIYMILFGLMILFFSYFWVATQFNPIQIADDLKKHGGYVPGIRPGKPTAEFFDRAMTRITLAGAVFLTIISILPSIVSAQFGIPGMIASFFGGTSLLIIVGVMLETMRQIESHLLMRHYDGFLKKGKLKSGRR